MEKQEMRTFLEELSAKGGGSLVKKVTRSKVDEHTRVLFIGLGGMGCKTVNAIKGVYEQDFASTPYISFLAVDTDEMAMSKLTIGTEGSASNAHLSASERFAIYSTDAQELLIHRPPVVEQWLSKDVPAEPISGDGAKARRVTGRVMLCGTGKYQALRDNISTRINNLCRGMTSKDKVSVVIIAGISGGTGSGTFVDVSYMARMLLDEKRNDNIASELYGVFYTPDVQKNIPAISGNPARWSNLRRNGYAALKELDYFVNVGDHKPGSEPVYSIRLPDGRTYETHTTMFEKSKVYLISASAGARDCDVILQQTAASLMNMFQTGFSDANGSQSVLSTFSNATADLQAWVNNNVGVGDSAGSVDKCGVKGCKFPRFMNYNFASLGFRSIYFPRNEMVAYCANEAFKQVYAQWHKAFNFTVNDVRTVAKQCGLGSVEQIYQIALQALGMSNLDFRVKNNDSAYPVRHGSSILGWVDNLDATMQEAADRVKVRLGAINTGINPIQGIVNQVIGFVEQGNFALNYGPYGGLVLLSGDGKNHSGLCGLLDSYTASMQNVITSKSEELQSARSAMQKACEIMAADRSPHDEEIETFVSACENFSQVCFEYEFYAKYMTALVSNLRNQLMAYNNKTFEIYVPIMETVKDILQEDATIFANTTLESHGDETTYSLSLNALSMNQANDMSMTFRSMFDGYVDPSMVAQVANTFVNSLFGEKSRQIWESYASNPEALSEEIRRVFRNISQPLISKMLERFIVLVYCSPSDVAQAIGHTGTLSIDDVNKLWDNQKLRDNALQSAAQNIVATLVNSHMISFSIDPTESKQFPKLMTVVLLNETPELNKAIAKELTTESYGGKPSITTIGDSSTCETKTAISMAMSVSPFPLAMVDGMRDYAEQYFKSEASVATGAGRHLDEVTEQWQTYLPEIYGVDAEDFFQARRRVNRIPDDMRARVENKVVNNDREMYDKIRTAAEYGLEKGYIRLGSIHGTPGDDSFKYYHILLPKTFDPEILSRIENKMSELSEREEAATWTDALRAIEAEEHEQLYVEYRLDDGMEAETLRSQQTAVPDNKFELKNLYRLIRAKMSSEKRVLEAMERFEESHFFHNVGNLGSFEAVVQKFCHAYMLGLVTHDEDTGWHCAYSDNPEDVPLAFFDDTYQEWQDDLDAPFRWYLVISAFSRIAEHEFLEDIEPMYKAARKAKQEMQSCAQIIADLEAGFQTNVMRMRDKDARAKKIATALKYSEFFSSKDPADDYYSFPRRCDGDGNTAIANIQQAFDCLKLLKDHKQIS